MNTSLSTLKTLEPEQVCQTWDKLIHNIKETDNVKEHGILNMIKHRIKSYSLEPIDEDVHAILTLLNNNILNWKNEKTTNLTHWDKLLGRASTTRKINIISRVLFECMEKNDTNIECIRNNMPTDISLYRQFFVQYDAYIENYPNLQNLSLTPEYFDCIFQNPDDMLRLLLNKQDTSGNIMNLIKHHIFTNKRFLNKLSNPSPPLPNLISYSILGTDTSTNIQSILNTFDHVFPKREDQLASLIGLITILENYTAIDAQKLPMYLEKVNTLFNQKYPDEFKLFNTCKTLGITDFNTLFTSVNNCNITYIDYNVELPELCL